MHDEPERLEVQVARIDERVLALTTDFKEFKDSTKELLNKIDDKMGTNTVSLSKYKSDRKFMIRVAAALYALLLAWVGSR